SLCTRIDAVGALLAGGAGRDAESAGFLRSDHAATAPPLSAGNIGRRQNLASFARLSFAHSRARWRRDGCAVSAIAGTDPGSPRDVGPGGDRSRRRRAPDTPAATGQPTSANLRD